MTNIRRTIEITTNVAILVICGLIAWTILGHRHVSANAPSGSEQHLEGIILPSLPAYNWRTHPQTLVLAVRRGCHFCENSLPFYKRLSDLEKSDHLRVHLLAVMPDDPGLGGKLLESNHVDVQCIFDEPLSSIHVSGTPTLLLVDAAGRVEKAWVGQLSQAQEADVISQAQS